MSSKTKQDVHRTITETIVEAIEKGAGAFKMPWHRTASIVRPANALTKAHYRGINVIALWVQCLDKGYLSDTWATYRQWNKLGAQVNKGEKASTIVFYKQVDVEADETDDEQENRTRLFARASRVFNAEQVSGWTPPSPEPQKPIQILANAENFIYGTKATIRHGGEEAYYDRKRDLIVVPPRGVFKGTPTSSARDSYYATVLHELTHWTGAPHRLDRTFGKRFGDEAYAMEELVAELGSAFLCADLGIANDPRPDHAAYMSSWLKVLEQDHRAIFTAASKASAATDYLGELKEAAPA